MGIEGFKALKWVVMATYVSNLASKNSRRLSSSFFFCLFKTYIFIIKRIGDIKTSSQFIYFERFFFCFLNFFFASVSPENL